MEIREFEDLTNFMSTEYLKMVDTYGFVKPSGQFSKFIEKTLQKYSHLYDKPLFKLKKKELKLVYKEEILKFKIKDALSTMPHGKIWQFFHGTVWQKMQPFLKNDEKSVEACQAEPKQVEPMTLEVVPKPTQPVIFDEDGDA